MPKIPTFTAQGSIEQLQGSTATPQISLTSTLATAIAPATKMLVDQKIQESNAQNQAEALRLENDYLTDLIKVSETINTDQTMSVNKDAANTYLKNKNNILINKYKSQATNNNVAIKFENYALAETQKTIFRNDTQISKNILTNLISGYEKQKDLLLITASTDTSGLAKSTLKTDLEKLTKDTFTSQLSAPELNVMINSIPGEIEYMDGLKSVQTEPRKTFYALKDKNYLPNLTFEQREKINKEALLAIRPQLTTEWENYTATVAAGKEPPRFDFDLAKEVFNSRVSGKMIEEDTFTKDRVTNNAVILNASNDTVNEVVEGIIDEGNELYGIKQAAEQENYYKAVLTKRNKDMKDDIVSYITTNNSEIASLYEQLELEDNQNTESALATKKLITEALIEEQKRLNVSESFIRITSKAEINRIKSTLMNVDTPYIEKEQFINSMITLYGNENMGKVLNHLQAEKLPIEYITAISTNSAELKKHILSGETVETLEKFVKDRLPTDEKFNKIERGVAKGMEDFETVILNQGEGSKLKTDYILSIQAAVYKSALQRVKEGENISEAVDNAVTSFTKDYFIAPDKTFMIPVDVGGKFVNQPIVYDKSQALKLMVEDTDYLTRFHGEDGYMHYAALAGIDNLSEEDVKKRIEFTIKNHSKWLMNGDGTGIVLNAEFTNGTYPIVNANGDKIEFFFTDTPNDKGIFSIELKAPVTGEDIDLIPFTSDVGAYEFEETNYDNTSENKNLLTTAIDSVGRVIDTAGDILISSAAAAEMPIMTNEKIANDWTTLYQTSNDPVKTERALKEINKNYTVPIEAKNSIAIGAKIFEGDKGLSQTELIQYGNAIGQIESEYKTKVQRGGGPARSYWQVEPETALDLFRNSSAIFGEKFEKAFAKYNKGTAIGKTAVKYLASLSEEKMSKLLESDSDLAATIALGVIVNRIKPKKKKLSSNEIRANEMETTMRIMMKEDNLSLGEASKYSRIIDNYKYGRNKKEGKKYRGTDKIILKYLYNIK